VRHLEDEDCDVLADGRRRAHPVGRLTLRAARASASPATHGPAATLEEARAGPGKKARQGLNPSPNRRDQRVLPNCGASQTRILLTSGWQSHHFIRKALGPCWASAKQGARTETDHSGAPLSICQLITGALAVGRPPISNHRAPQGKARGTVIPVFAISDDFASGMRSRGSFVISSPPPAAA
jgi:hypothetical protein